MVFSNRSNLRRNHLRKNIAEARLMRISSIATVEFLSFVLMWMIFICLSTAIISLEMIQHRRYAEIVPTLIIVGLFSAAAAFYIYHHENRIVTNPARAAALLCLFIFLLGISKTGIVLTQMSTWATGTAIITAIILTIAYDQRFAMGMSVFYSLLAGFTVSQPVDISLFLTMMAGTFTCCAGLKEIRTRMKLLEIIALAASIVFLTAVSLSFFSKTIRPMEVFKDAAMHALATFVAGFIIQSLLPVIETVFGITTSMTLLDYSDINKPLLKRLAMEAPGTYSHCLTIGAIAETAAESIGRNGLLCRVGAYYHDIGKLNKPLYFVENQMDPSFGRHKDLSPAMSQLIIIGHVKDGLEMAREYGLPKVLWQFIETHHGTTLVEYFYNQAKKQYEQDEVPDSQAPSESEFRYPGPKPQTIEAAILMLADGSEGAVRSLPEITPTRIEAVVHNMAMKRLQDGQFDECDMTLRELSQIEASLASALAAHYHSRIAYPKRPDLPEDFEEKPEQAADNA